MHNVIKGNEIFTFCLTGRTLHSLMVFSQTQTRQAAQASVLKGFKAVKRAVHNGLKTDKK